MSHLIDFRAGRCRLPPEAFAIVRNGLKPPQDLIKEDTWNSIVSLTDDVSLQTSDYHGSELKVMNELWGDWIESLGEKKDPMFHTMLDAGDEFQACTFNSLVGYYRVASSCLRSALELNIIGTYLQLSLGLPIAKIGYSNWVKKVLPIRYGKACDHMHKDPLVQPLEEYLNSEMDYSVFGQKSGEKQGGWARKLYSELSDFAHSRPTHAAVVMWQGSNGPIYVTSSFMRVFALYMDTMALSYALVKLVRPEFKCPRTTNYFFTSKYIRPSKVAVLTYRFLWKNKVCDI